MADLARLYDFTPSDVIRSSEVDAELNQLVARINDIDADSLSAALAALLGVSQAGSVSRGKSIIATEEARSNTSYGLLTTPDRVQSIVLPTDGLIRVSYSALWKSSVGIAGRAAIFVGSNQLKVRPDGGAPLTQGAATDSEANSYRGLASSPLGLLGSGGSSAATSDVTTGQVVGVMTVNEPFWGELNGSASSDVYNVPFGGECLIFAAAGTYDISVQFRATSGSVTAKERKLWVWAMGF